MQTSKTKPWIIYRFRKPQPGLVVGFGKQDEMGKEMDVETESVPFKMSVIGTCAVELECKEHKVSEQFDLFKVLEGGIIFECKAGNHAWRVTMEPEYYPVKLIHLTRKADAPGDVLEWVKSTLPTEVQP